MKPIYLDHNATTPLAPEVFEAIEPILKDNFGNPSSIHSAGRAARVRLDEAREQVAALIGAHPSEIVFTSGGTESDNLAILGLARALRDKGRHIITTQIEHPAVLNPCRQLETEGFEVDYLPVDRWGRVERQRFVDALREDTLLVSIQHSNSEIGTLQEVDWLARQARERGVFFHSDAVQSVGKLPVRVEDLGIDLLSLSAHKMYGPKGSGAIWIKRGTPPLVPVLRGGGQEKKRRGGTENVAGIVGLGKAAELARARMEEDVARIAGLRRYLVDALLRRLEGVEIHGHAEYCLPNTVSVSIDGVSGQSLLVRLDIEGVSVSTGTACSSGAAQPSEVLTALGLSPDRIESTLRLSLGRGTSKEDIDRVLDILSEAAQAIRERDGRSVPVEKDPGARPAIKGAG